MQFIFSVPHCSEELGLKNKYFCWSLHKRYGNQEFLVNSHVSYFAFHYWAWDWSFFRKKAEDRKLILSAPGMGEWCSQVEWKQQETHQHSVMFSTSQSQQVYDKCELSSQQGFRSTFLKALKAKAVNRLSRCQQWFAYCLLTKQTGESQLSRHLDVLINVLWGETRCESRWNYICQFPI